MMQMCRMILGKSPMWIKMVIFILAILLLLSFCDFKKHVNRAKMLNLYIEYNLKPEGIEA